MQAIQTHKFGGPEVLSAESKVEKPVAGDDQVLVQVASAGLNYIDTYHRTGLYPVQHPFIPGREGAGVVEAVGKNVSKFKKGDRVTFLAGSTYAEYCVVAENRCVALPSAVSLIDAGGLLLQGLTAHYLTHSSYPIKQGDTVLIHAAAGGTGGLMVQMAKILGATVIATVGTDDKAAIAKSLGADHVIVYSREDFLERTKQITQNVGVHAVYDGVGKATWEKSMLSLRKRGYLVLFGNASGPVPPIDPLTLTKHGSLFVTRPSLVDHVEGGEFAQRTADLTRWLAEKKISLRIAKTFPLHEANKAHELLTSRQVAGKILLVPPSGQALDSEPNLKKAKI